MSGEVLPSVASAGHTGSVTITSSPPGADVVLDGEFRGLAPVRVASLSPGTHTISLTLPCFREHTEQFTVEPGEEKAIHAVFGFHEFQLPGLAAITGLFSGVKIGLPPLPFGGEAQKEQGKTDREKAYEELVKQVEEGED